MKNSFPDVIRIETVGICNFNCIHCPTGVDPNNRKVLKPKDFEYIMQQFKNEKFIPRVVVLYHGGEPLLNKWLPEYITYLKEYGVKKTLITTNASLLNTKISQKLILSGLDEMKVSFDGNSAEENNKIRQGGDFKRDSSNLLNFLKIKKKLSRDNPKVIVSNIRVVKKSSLKDKIPQFTFTPTLTCKDIPNFLLETFGDFREEVLFRSFPACNWTGLKSLGFNEVKISGGDINYCSNLFETTTIQSDGNVVACCYDIVGEEVFGNIKLQSIFDIWNTKKYVKFRKNFTEKKYSRMCENCTVVQPRILVK